LRETKIHTLSQQRRFFIHSPDTNKVKFFTSLSSA